MVCWRDPDQLLEFVEEDLVPPVEDLPGGVVAHRVEAAVVNSTLTNKYFL